MRGDILNVQMVAKAGLEAEFGLACIADYGGLQVDLLKLTIGLPCFNFTMVSDWTVERPICFHRVCFHRHRMHLWVVCFSLLSVIIF